MKFRYLASFALVLLFSSAASALEFSETEGVGQLLTQEVESNKSISLTEFSNSENLAQFLGESKCADFDYDAFIVDHGNGNKKFYYIASSGKDVIVGRHFSAPIQGSAVEIDRIKSSTRSCLNLGNPPKNTAALFTTHLENTPNEFHILVSNLRDIDLFVGTQKRIFQITNGKILVVEEN